MIATERPQFYSAYWDHPANDSGWLIFKVGKCSGQWRSTKDNYEILSFLNDEPGNGDFANTLDWFYESCIRDKRNLLIREVWNERLAKHLIGRGFTYAINNDLIKRF